MDHVIRMKPRVQDCRCSIYIFILTHCKTTDLFALALRMLKPLVLYHMVWFGLSVWKKTKRKIKTERGEQDNLHVVSVMIDSIDGESLHVLCVCVFVHLCTQFMFGSCVFCGSSVELLPHAVNMSLWWDCRVWGMLSCGRATNRHWQESQETFVITAGRWHMRDMESLYGQWLDQCNASLLEAFISLKNFEW